LCALCGLLSPVFDIVCAANRFDEARARLYFIQLAQGVAYMHAHLICHLDLSLENLLMTDDDVLKICDFGLARMMELDERRHLVAYKGVAKNKPGKMGYMSENTKTWAKDWSTVRMICFIDGIILFLFGSCATGPLSCLPVTPSTVICATFGVWVRPTHTPNTADDVTHIFHLSLMSRFVLL
jgi:serine/threonine protein kinase